MLLKILIANLLLCFVVSTFLYITQSKDASNRQGFSMLYKYSIMSNVLIITGIMAKWAFM